MRRITIDLEDQLADDLAAFRDQESLSDEELAGIVHKVLADKGAEFVQLAAENKLAKVREEALNQAEKRKEEIAAGITVTAETL